MEPFRILKGRTMFAVSPVSLTPQTRARWLGRFGRSTTLLVLLSLVALAGSLLVTPGLAAAATPLVQVSSHADRSDGATLEAAVLQGNAYVYVPDDGAGIARVEFWLDDPDMSGTPYRSERSAPWDFAGGSASTANAWSTTAVSDGTHTITARVTTSAGAASVVSASFTVRNQTGLAASPSAVAIAGSEAGSPARAVVSVTSPAGTTFEAQVSVDVAWASVTSARPSGSEMTIGIEADPVVSGVGTHQATISVTPTTGTYAILRLPVSFTVATSGASTGIVVSERSDRSNGRPLEGADVSGDVYVFTAPDPAVSRVSFWVDNPSATGTPYRTEKSAPFDLNGGTSSTAVPFDTRALADGLHSVTARSTLVDGSTRTTSATFNVRNESVARLVLSTTAATTTFATPTEPAKEVTAQLSTSDGAVVSAIATADRAWASASLDPVSPGVSTLRVRVDPQTLPSGTSEARVDITSTTHAGTSFIVRATVSETTATAALVYGTDDRRTGRVLLDGATLTGVVYAYIKPDEDVRKVEFWLDDPAMTSAPFRVDQSAPFDLVGKAANGTALPFDSASLPDGEHTYTTRVTTTATSLVLQSTFTTSNGTNSLSFAQEEYTVEVAEGADPVTFQVAVDADTDGTPVALTADASFIGLAQEEVVTPSLVSITVNAAGLSPGVFTTTVTASSPGAFSDALMITVQVGDSGGCSPVACELIKVPTPYDLNWLYDSGLMIDASGAGTGFSTVLPTADGKMLRDRSAYAVDLNDGRLTVQASSGSLNTGDQQNALGVGFDGPLAQTTLSTTVVDVPASRGKYEKAGLWFGYSQSNVAALQLVGVPGGWRLEYTVELDGATIFKKQASVVLPAGAAVSLNFRTDPAKRTLAGTYAVTGEPLRSIGTATLPGEFFSFDAAGIDPRIGTRSFAGVLATSRNSSTPIPFSFSQFSVSADPVVDSAGAFVFDRVASPLAFPTSIATGPDGEVFVTDLFGDLHVLRLNADHTLVKERTVEVLGNRLALGVAVEPTSTSEDVRVLVAHSSPVTDHGVVDSGRVTRLSGPDFATTQDIVTGLPRSYANHGPTSLHFGPDDVLYMAIGGNTGAGGANLAATEFGDRGEQALSAALITADIYDPTFDGSCQNMGDMYGPAPCDVEVFASGLRNMYDFTFHSNGTIYGTDNGLGVEGSYPPSPIAPCFGFGDTRPWTQGGNNPGTQNDEINRIVAGGYYGHPNPARGECVFGDGSFQGVPVPTNYVAPLLDTGRNRSTNGIVEYSSEGGFCGLLDGSLIYGNYSLGDNLAYASLSPDGEAVVANEPLLDNLRDPLPIGSGPNGTLLVGEFGAGQVTVLVPRETGCWQEAAPLPQDILDAGGTAIDRQLYVIGGKNGSGPKSTLRVYDAESESWSLRAPLPGVAVENPAVTAYLGRLYVAGGSTEAFAGATSQFASYDPATDSWTTLPPLPTPRGGATAQWLQGRLIVVGGMDTEGRSVDTVEIYDPTTERWSAGPRLATPRDNAASAVVGTRMYVVGGRTRESTGVTTAPTLASMEVLDVDASAWVPGPSMPTGRRTAAAGVLDGKVVVAGGEARADGLAFSAVEVFDPATGAWSSWREMPTGRHGAAAGVIDGQLHVVGGGRVAGFSTDVSHEVLAPPS
ncbi:Kelch repeat-containing protein [Aquipuribacter nitratireducens]|uniref:PQQ-dependent sugar dehydrogenase n=1 Tax=Aquipuribacter nitratireducens TaxID=650104 RepID=A0ABW0GPN1_9MICO